jgi:hypothetical protein
MGLIERAIEGRLLRFPGYVNLIDACFRVWNVGFESGAASFDTFTKNSSGRAHPASAAAVCLGAAAPDVTSSCLGGCRLCKTPA